MILNDLPEKARAVANAHATGNADGLRVIAADLLHELAEALLDRALLQEELTLARRASKP